MLVLEFLVSLLLYFDWHLFAWKLISFGFDGILLFLWCNVGPNVELCEEAEEEDRVTRDVVGELSGETTVI